MSDTETVTTEKSQLPPKTVTGFRQPKPGPALIVLGLAALITALGGLLAFVGSSSSSKNSVVLGKLKGEPLIGESASFIVNKIKQTEQPPADVASNIVVPIGSSIKSIQKSTNLALFNAAVTLSIPDSPKQVEQFFKVELAHDGWSLPNTYAPPSGVGTELLSKIPSSDGFYWGIGIVMTKANPTISPALAGSSQNASYTTTKITLYEINDAS
ncbi:MAG: hypothetical protein M1374_07270 [Firmicutes bacterium]|jgi:hypothetical protein|nr:hypothetical protein [Bacillota bacterium]